MDLNGCPGGGVKLKPVPSHVSDSKKKKKNVAYFFRFFFFFSFDAAVLSKMHTGREFLADSRQNQVSEHLGFFLIFLPLRVRLLDRFLVVELNAVQKRQSFWNWARLRLYFPCLPVVAAAHSSWNRGSRLWLVEALLALRARRSAPCAAHFTSASAPCSRCLRINAQQVRKPKRVDSVIINLI